MDLVKLSALKDEKFTSMVIGAVTIIAIAPLGWLSLIDPLTIYISILTIAGSLIGADLTGRVSAAVKKAKESNETNLANHRDHDPAM